MSVERLDRRKKLFNLQLDHFDWAIFQLYRSVAFPDVRIPCTLLSYVPHSLERFPDCVDFDKGALDGPKDLEVIGTVKITGRQYTISWIQVTWCLRGKRPFLYLPTG